MPGMTAKKIRHTVAKGGLRMRKPSREALTKRIWFDYFNEVLRKQNLIDWNTYQKIKLSIQQ